MYPVDDQGPLYLGKATGPVLISLLELSPGHIFLLSGISNLQLESSTLLRPGPNGIGELFSCVLCSFLRPGLPR